jgi:HD-like signal output (HDOD) protein
MSQSPDLASVADNDALARAASAFAVAEYDSLEAKLACVASIPPVSQAAFDVLRMVESNRYAPLQIAAAVARDASLCADVLRVANRGAESDQAKNVVVLEDAVVRIGPERLGELALANSKLAENTAPLLRWINVDSVWRRSVAAGVAIDLILAQGDYSHAGEGLFMSAILHPLGRVVLGTLYPEQQQRMTKICDSGGQALEEQEEQAYCLTHGQVLASLLRMWNIPDAICAPIAYAFHSYPHVATLEEPLRTKTELLKVAILIGRMAAGDWECCDRLEFPPASLLERLGVHWLSRLVPQTRSDSQKIIDFRPEA